MTLQNTPQYEGGSAHKPADLQALLGLGRSTVYKLLRSGELRSVRAGRRIIVPATAVADFLAGRK